MSGGGARNRGRGALPNIIVIGAMKCGTTSLHHYLSRHPEITMSREKELNFFIEERTWSMGPEWYASWFAGGTRLRGESSPNYTAYPQFDGVPERMHALIPDARLIYVVRDPIDRMISQYIHHYAEATEHRPIEDALLDDGPNRYVAVSSYFMQIQRYLQYYPQSNLLVISAEELLSRRAATIRRVFEFLGVDPSYSSWWFTRTRHSSIYKRRKGRLGALLARSGADAVIRRLPVDLRWHVHKALYLPFSTAVKRPEISDEVRQQLASRLSEDVGALRRLVGQEFGEWTI